MKHLFEKLQSDPDFYEEFLDYYDGPEENARAYFNHSFGLFLSKLDRLNVENTSIKLWRMISAPTLEDLNLDQVGASWSYHKDSAHSWYGGEGESYLVEGVVDFSEIDLDTTCRQNLVNCDEDEIRLNSNVDVYITKIYQGNKLVQEFNPPKLSSSGKVGVFGNWNE